MKRYQITLLFIVIIATCKASITPMMVDTSEINRQVRDRVIDGRIIRSDINFFSNIIYLNDSTLLYNPEGTLHLFKIQIDSTTQVTKLSKSIYHGHNFGRDLYLHNSILYSLGGSGLFGETPHLLYFNESLSEWLRMPIQGGPLNIGSVVSSWLYTDTLSVIYKSKLEDSLIYAKINLKTKISHRIGAIKNSSVESYRIGLGKEIFNNGKYAIFELPQSNTKYSNCRYELFLLPYAEYLRFQELESLPCISGKSTIYIKDDTLVYRNAEGELNHYFIDDLTVITKINYSDRFKSAFEDKNKRDSIVKLPIVLLIIGVFVLIGLIIFKKKTYLHRIPKHEIISASDQNISDSESEILGIENLLIDLKGQTISRNRLDEIFAITHQSSDTMKSNRSIKIRKINERGKLSIIRKRNIRDKRYFEYLID